MLRALRLDSASGFARGVPYPHGVWPAKLGGRGGACAWCGYRYGNREIYSQQGFGIEATTTPVCELLACKSGLSWFLWIVASTPAPTHAIPPPAKA